MSKKVYQVNDLFFTDWKQLSPKSHLEVYVLQQKIKTDGITETKRYGYQVIALLQRLRKNFKLINKINEEQAVDIYNDLKFLDESWYYFRSLERYRFKKNGLITPDEKLARHSFDRFIFADHEFTSYLYAVNAGIDEAQCRNYLVRLAITLYPLRKDSFFDPETVDERTEGLGKMIKDWELQLVFFTYAHVRESIMKRCKHLLPQEPVKTYEEGQEREPPAVTPSGPMWHEIKHMAARTGALGPLNEVGRSRMYDVLDHLELIAKNKPPHGNS
jgi:hypothetical protein